MNFKKALAEFACKLWRKWFPEITIKKYLRLTERIYKDCWKIENRKEITSKEIENWIFFNKKISVGTKNIYAVQIRAFLKFCKSLDLPVVNPEQITVQKNPLKEARYLNTKEEKKMIEELQYENLNLRAGINLMLNTWMRISEACSMTKKQFRWAEIVEWLYQIPICWKGNKTRAIFLPPETYKICEKISQKHNKKSVLGITTKQLQKIIKKFSREIEIVFTAHTLRHTYLTKLAQKGADIYKIQKIAGHTCIITTSRYLHTHNIELARIAWLITQNSY